MDILTPLFGPGPPRLVIALLPLEFCGKLRVLRTMHIPAALHGAEASFVSIAGLRVWLWTGTVCWCSWARSGPSLAFQRCVSWVLLGF